MTFTQAPTSGRGRTARLRALARLATLRATFAALEQVAPDRGAAKALDLWCTLPSNVGRRRDLRPRAGEVTRHPVPRGGEVVAESWGQGPTVYLVHGWGGWRGQLGAFVQPLVDSGRRVVTFDAPGHGESDAGEMGPGRGNLMELMEAFDAVAQGFGPASGVVAHSLGCTSASEVVAAGLPTDRLVLIGPSDDFSTLISDFAGTVGLGERIHDGLVGRIEDYCGRSLDSFDLGPRGARGQMPPTLVVHDRRDKESPYAVGERLAAAWPATELLATDGLGHQRILSDVGTVARVVGYVAGDAR